MESLQVVESGSLYLEQFLCGPMANCVYLLADRATGKAFILDPAFEPAELHRIAGERGFEVSAVLCTHAHQDHVGGEIFGMQIPGLRELREVAELPVYIHGTEVDYLVDKTSQPRESLRLLEDGQSLALGDLEFSVHHLPGHSPGCCAFLAAGQMIVGDAVFVQGVGRVDLPGSNVDDMFSSLQKIKAMDQSIQIFPGHNYGPSPSSTIGRELQLNPYLGPSTLEQWRAMMGRF